MTTSVHLTQDNPRKSSSNLAYIDMLRGFAILGVFLVHSTLFGMRAVGLDAMPMNMEWLLLAGRHGVTLFFVVSAFTLMRSMHLRIENEHMPMRKYFLRRFFRIAPTYYFILFAVFFLYGYGVPSYSNPQEATLKWGDLIAHLLFVNSFYPYYTNDFVGVEWSVSTEFMFYLLLPFIFLWLRDSSRRQAKMLLLLSVTLVLYWLIAFKGSNLQLLGGAFASPLLDVWRYFFIATHFPAFVVGVVTWHLVSPRASRLSKGATAETRKYIVTLSFLMCVALAGVYFFSMDNRPSDPVFSWFGLIFWAVLSGVLIYVLDSLRPAKVSVLTLLAGLGRVSFSLYLVHFPICAVLSRPHQVWQVFHVPALDFLIFEFSALGLSYLVAVLLFKFVEKPGIELGRNLVARLSAQRSVLVGS